MPFAATYLRRQISSSSGMIARSPKPVPPSGLGAHDFLVMPAEASVVQSILARAMAESAAASGLVSAQEYGTLAHKLRGQFIVQMFNNVVPPKLDRDYIRRHFNYRLRGQYMQIICFKCDTLSKGEQNRADPHAPPLEQVQKLLTRKLENSRHEFGLIIWAETLLCFLNYDDGDNPYDYWMEFSKAVRGHIRELNKYSFTVALGSVIEDPEDILKSVYTARRALRCRNILGTTSCGMRAGFGAMCWTRGRLSAMR